MPTGVFYAIVAYSVYSCGDAIIKGFGQSLSVFDIGFFVAVVSLIPAAGVERRGERGGGSGGIGRRAARREGAGGEETGGEQAEEPGAGGAWSKGHAAL